MLINAEASNAYGGGLHAVRMRIAALVIAMARFAINTVGSSTSLPHQSSGNRKSGVQPSFRHLPSIHTVDCTW